MQGSEKDTGVSRQRWRLVGVVVVHWWLRLRHVLSLTSAATTTTRRRQRPPLLGWQTDRQSPSPSDRSAASSEQSSLPTDGLPEHLVVTWRRRELYRLTSPRTAGVVVSSSHAPARQFSGKFPLFAVWSWHITNVRVSFSVQTIIKHLCSQNLYVT